MRYELLMEAENDEFLILDEPTNYIKPISDIDSKKWLETLKSEIYSMYTNQAWTLIDLFEGIKSIGCKLVFTRKTDMDTMYKYTKLD